MSRTPVALLINTEVDSVDGLSMHHIPIIEDESQLYNALRLIDVVEYLIISDDHKNTAVLVGYAMSVDKPVIEYLTSTNLFIGTSVVRSHEELSDLAQVSQPL